MKPRVGLLGGSFDPAHSGHLHLSLKAIDSLNLAYVIWLVSPQNPCKLSKTTQNLSDRCRYATRIATDKRIIISDFEKCSPTPYTSDTISKLQLLYPEITFIWLMGADNMAQIHQWHNWHSIFQSVFVAVFDRAEYTEAALASEASNCYKALETSDNNLAEKSLVPGRWHLFKDQVSPLSSTMLRESNQMHCNSSANLLKQACLNNISHSFEYLKDVILSGLDHDQAEGIVLLDISERSSFARYMIVASGKSCRHISAMTRNLMDRLKAINISSSASGLESTDWVLLDAGDVIVHIFLPEARLLYKIEELWS